MEFNPLAPDFQSWPYPSYRALQETSRVSYSELLAGWLITGYEDVANLLKDPASSVMLENATQTPFVKRMIEHRDARPRAAETIVLQDDPAHARLRRLMAPPFRPKAIMALAPMIAKLIDRALADLAVRTEPGVPFDVVEEFVYPLPVEIFSTILGVPEEDHPQFRWWAQCVARSIDPIMSDEERFVALSGLDDMFQYLEIQLERKRQEPADDLLSELIHASDEGDQLTKEELMAQILTLYVAGHEPVSAVIGNGLVALFNAPDQLDRLRNEPDLRPNALEELLRFDGPNQFVRRVATTDLRIGGQDIERGSLLYLCLGAANRDPARWGRSVDQLIVDRVDASQHLQFGAGPHLCLGRHMGRIQAAALLDALLDRFGGLCLAGEVRWSNRMIIRTVAEIPVTATIR